MRTPQRHVYRVQYSVGEDIQSVDVMCWAPAETTLEWLSHLHKGQVKILNIELLCPNVISLISLEPGWD